MDKAKLHSAIGFAQRSGNCVSGDFAVERAVKRGAAKIVALDMSASDATKARYRGLCERAGVPCLIMEDMDRAIGKEGRKVAAVTDERFAMMMIEANANTDGGVS